MKSRREPVNIIRSLGLIHLTFCDVSHVDSDPMESAAIKDSEEVIERCLRHTERLPGGAASRERGKELWKRLARIGVQ